MRRRILFLLVIMSALAVRAYEKIPLRLDYDRDIYGETVRDDRSLSMCVSAFHDGRLVTVCSEKVLEDVSIRVRDGGGNVLSEQTGITLSGSYTFLFEGDAEGTLSLTVRTESEVYHGEFSL